VRHDYLSSEEHNEVDPTEWRKLLRSSNNVKDLRIDVRLVKEFSRCLQSDDGRLQREILHVPAAAILVTRSPNSSKLATQTDP
jgi:hypothetical protein